MVSFHNITAIVHLKMDISVSLERQVDALNTCKLSYSAMRGQQSVLELEGSRMPVPVTEWDRPARNSNSVAVVPS